MNWRDVAIRLQMSQLSRFRLSWLRRVRGRKQRRTPNTREFIQHSELCCGAGPSANVLDVIQQIFDHVRSLSYPT